jgi:DNA primase
MFPLMDARGRVIGFQARKLREDDPLRGKYVNSPESDLFKKSNVLYGLHLARPAIAKQDRAVVVEGNTDVIALRQAGFEPVVAAMGTALTEGHLREFGRLTRLLVLCFDADAAGQDATLRGMELAVQQGFDIRVVTLPGGQDPADAPDGFEERLASAESYALYRVRIEIDRSSDRQEAFVRAREVLARVPESVHRHEAVRLLGDRLDLPKASLEGLPGYRVSTSRSTGEATSSIATAGERLERDTLAACVAHAGLRLQLAALSEEHFDLELHRRFRAALVGDLEEDAELVGLRAELDARAEREAIDERTGQELLLRVRERQLRRDLQGADLARTTELQAHLTKVRQALAELA